MPKAKHHYHGEPKTEAINARLTPTGKTGLSELAGKYGLSVAELIDRVGQGKIKLTLPSELVGESSAS